MVRVKGRVAGAFGIGGGMILEVGVFFFYLCGLRGGSGRGDKRDGMGMEMKIQRMVEIFFFLLCESGDGR